MLDANRLVGSHDILLLILDTLRHDVAVASLREGHTPNLAAVLPKSGWEERHAPGSFTYAAHQAIFAGFLPTPAQPGRHERLFAVRFPGSETIGPRTCILDAPDIVRGLAGRSYHTLCIGGVGFFNPCSPLGTVLPGLFAESHWRPAFGVTDLDSTANQVAFTCRRLAELPADRRVFVFLNVSAIHQPNRGYLPGATEDTLASHAAALAYVDSQLPPLFVALRQRGSTLCIISSDHGTAYGEDGYVGHRLGHPVVWTVPYAEFVLEGYVP